MKFSKRTALTYSNVHHRSSNRASGDRFDEPSFHFLQLERAAGFSGHSDCVGYDFGSIDVKTAMKQMVAMRDGLCSLENAARAKL